MAHNIIYISIPKNTFSMQFVIQILFISFFLLHYDFLFAILTTVNKDVLGVKIAKTNH